MFCTSQRNAESLSLSAAHRRRRRLSLKRFSLFRGRKNAKKKRERRSVNKEIKRPTEAGKRSKNTVKKRNFFLLLSLNRPSPKEGRHACKRSKMGKRWFLALPAPFYFRSYRQSQLAKQASSLSMLPHLSDTFVFAEKQSGDWIEAQQLARNVTTTNSSSFPFLFPYRKRIEKLFSHTRFFFFFFSFLLPFHSACAYVSLLICHLSQTIDYIHVMAGIANQSTEKRSRHSIVNKRRRKRNASKSDENYSNIKCGQKQTKRESFPVYFRFYATPFARPSFNTIRYDGHHYIRYPSGCVDSHR